MLYTDVIVVGAGAAGFMCAIEAAKRGRRVILIDHANKPGKKILMSGGGRCNFTNYDILPENYLSHNPHFFKSALKQYTQWDFIALVDQYKIPYFEKTKGQLFCQNKAKDIVNMLLSECDKYGVIIKLNTPVNSINQPDENKFHIKTNDCMYEADSCVIATGGLSIPTLGATGFGYDIAKQFNLNCYPTRAGLVPLTLHDQLKQQFSDLPGVSVESEVHCNKMSFQEGLLFTHKGLSGPAILQISSYWKPGDTIQVALNPELDLSSLLNNPKKSDKDKNIKTILSQFYPKKIITSFLPTTITDKSLKQLNKPELDYIYKQLKEWEVLPAGSEGYRTAEVTLGGVEVDQISSKTMETKTVPGLFFIGEVLDVTGWLGGYNFQWAWSSGFVAGQYV